MTPCQNHHIVPPKIDRNLPPFFPFFPLPLSLFPLIFLPSSFFPLSEVTLFEPSTGRLGSPLFLHFFLILTQARIQMHSQSCSWICVCFSLFSLYFQGFSAVSLLFFFVFSLFEKEENKRESCLRRYETVWGAVKRSEALGGLMKPTVRIEGLETETEAVEEPLPL